MNYKQLIEDSNNGKLDPHVNLAMDNDGGYFWIDSEASEEEQEKITDALEEKYGLPDGHNDIVEVLQASGVKCDWC